MKESTIGAGTSKRKKLKRRNVASYKNLRTHSDKISDYRHGPPLKSPMAEGRAEGRESIADREYRRMRDGDVYRGSSHKTPHSNKSQRRYK
jgi:hypothetical protein